MRKLIVTAVAVALVAGAFSGPAAEAKKKKAYKRTATTTYAAPSHGAGDVAWGCVFSAENCARFATGAKDRYVTLTAEDQAGQDVWLQVSQPDSNGDGLTENVAEGCGGTTKVAIPAAGAELIIYVPVVGSILNSCPGPATTGTVKAVFTSK
jgi:hypothetical protein